MLRIGPLLLATSRKRAATISSISCTKVLAHIVCLPSSLDRGRVSDSSQRFFSSNKVPEDDDGDVAIRRSPASFVASLHTPLPKGSTAVDDGKPGFYKDRNQSHRRQDGQNRPVREKRSHQGHSNDDGSTRGEKQNYYKSPRNHRSYEQSNHQHSTEGSSRGQQRNRPQANSSNYNTRVSETLSVLLTKLKESAAKPPVVSSPRVTEEPLPPVKPLPQKGSVGPAPFGRDFRFRPPAPQTGDSMTDTSTTRAKAQQTSGYRMPQQQQRARPQQTNDRHGDNVRNTTRPTFLDSIEFLEGGRRGQTDSAERPSTSGSTKPSMEETRVVILPGTRLGLDLAETSALFRIKIDDIQRKLKAMDFAPEELNDKDFRLDTDTLELLALEFGIETVRGEDESLVVDSEELLFKQRRADDAVTFPSRPPVVCIMGHVDHGKTTLMDALRRRSLAQLNPKAKKGKGKTAKSEAESSDIAGTEAGGITQIISAFQVNVEGQDNKVTFLDTPGHAAFKSMRQSGSHAADVIVLVVAADDGVSEQTIEILDFYKSIVKGTGGGISMVVALNKIDKPGIDVDEAKRRIENQLLEQGIICEGMAGDSEYGPPVQVIPTSGLTGQGLDELMDGLILQSEVMDLRADQDARAEGIVMDARMEKGLGVVADCIVRWGSIKKGDWIVSGAQASRVRMLKDVNDKVLKCGLPSQPVQIVGFKSLPRAGDPIICVESEEVAEEMVEQRLAMDVDDPVDRPMSSNDVEIHINGMRSRDTRRAAKVIELAGLEDGDGTIRIPIVVKADADGSLSAVRDSLISLGVKSKHKVIVDPIQEGIGEITPTDIQMAKESDACIFAFGLKRIDQAVLNLAEAEGVIIRSNDIIYSLLDDAKQTLGRYLPPQPSEQIHGRASIQATFVVTTEGTEEKVAGLKVLEGNLYKAKGPTNVHTQFRVYRNGSLISPENKTIKASSLRKFKELVESVRHGEECGLGLSGFDEFEKGDEIVCYSVEMKTATL